MKPFNLSVALVFCAVALLPCILAHLCMVEPRQRGPLDVSHVGDDSCFRYLPNCGGSKFPAEKPTMTLLGGQAFQISFTQAANHYAEGHPGMMEVALGASDSIPDDQWIVLNNVPDFNAHFQWTLTNMTTSVMVPNVDCDPCVLRMRYISHKPTEPIFHQCSDVIVKKSTADVPSTHDDSDAADDENSEENAGGVPKNSVVALVYSNDMPVAKFAVLDALSGKVEPVYDLQFMVRAVENEEQEQQATSPTPFISDAVVALDPVSRTLYYTASFGDIGSAPTSLIAVQMDSGSTTVFPMSWVDETSTYVSLDWDLSTRTLIALGLRPSTTKQGSFNYFAHRITIQGEQATKADLFVLPDEDTFVNIMWTELDAVRGIYYLLAGDENSPIDLRNKMFVINVKTGAVNSWIPDFSQYTIASFHVDALRGGALYALSPGLPPAKGGNSTWAVVQLLPDASVKPLFEIAEAHEYASFYGGGVVNFDATKSQFVQILKTGDGSEWKTVTVNYALGTAKFSQAFSQALPSVHNAVYV